MEREKKIMRNGRKRLKEYFFCGILVCSLFSGCAGESGGERMAAQKTGFSYAYTESLENTKKSGEEILVSETSTDVIGKFRKGTVEKSFYKTKITKKIWKRIQGKSYKSNCIVPKKDLRYLHVLHKDIDGNTLEGEMICNVYIAGKLLKIFKKLYKAGYPIEKIRLVDSYNADDEASMEDNNSSCFNFRFISGTKRVSKHGLGLAVDINTLYNPYIRTVNGKKQVQPVTAKKYTNRSKSFPYKIEKGDLCYRLFKKYGFEWGGNWKYSKDYQHFEMPTSVAKKLYPKYG